MNGNPPKWPAVAIAFATLFVLAAFFALAVQPGCSASPCKGAVRGSGVPSSSIECPSGQLCYEGQCRKSCNAGEERATECSGNADCKDSSRPNCLSFGTRSFCSSCATSETCIPGLNICQPVAEIALPPDPTAMVVTVPPALDGGPIDAVSLIRDTGSQMEPSPAVITHRGSIIIEQATDFRLNPNAMERPSVRVEFLDVRGAALSSRKTNIARFGQCDLDRLDVYTATAAPVPANLGPIRVENDTRLSRPALTATLSAAFNPMTSRYDVMPAALPPLLLNLSNGNDSRVLQVVSEGLMMLVTRWPDPPSPRGYHSPFRLAPLSATQEMTPRPALGVPELRNTIEIQSGVPQDLVFAWTPLRGFGHTDGEKVVVELTGQRFGIHCEEEEGTPQSRSDITIRSALLTGLMALDHIPRDGTILLPLSFGRVFEQELSVPPEGSSMVVVFATIRISHSFYAAVRF